LSVVVPFFDEMHRLGERIGSIVALASDDVEVILVDDGSTDGTPDALARAADGRDHVRVVARTPNRGKGAAVRAGVLASAGERILFMDADVATDLADIPVIVAALDEADVAIGAREDAASVLRGTSRARTAVGNAFNAMVRGVTGLPYRDTQCGFKAFRGDVGRRLFGHTHVEGFAFDVEILMLARATGSTIVEVPVRWTEVPGSKVRFGVDPARMLLDVVRLRRSVRRSAAQLRAATAN
jgi:glycosyltransferase involved in cell wall biosynthesis